MDSEVILSNGSTAFVGEDAVKLFQAAAVATALRLYARTGIIMARGAKVSDYLRVAGQFTGKTYKRGQHMQAATDLQVWVDTMKAAMPVTNNRTPGA